MIRTFCFAALVFLCLAPAQGQQKTSPLELTLPPTIFAATDVPTSIYFDNIVLTRNPNDYRFEVTCAVGEALGRNWAFQPTADDKGTSPIRIDVFGEQDRVIASASSVLRVVGNGPRNSAKPIRLLVIGDSLTNASAYPNEVARLLSQHEGVNWKMLGTHKPTSAAEGVAHEGYGGWTWSNFVSKFDPSPDGNKKRSSPFVFASDGSPPQLDMHRYFQEKCNGQLPDYVVILLGINDCFSAPADDPTGVDARIDQMLAHAEQLIAAIHKAAPKTQIGFCLTTPPNARQEAFQANYQDRYRRWGWKRIQHRLVQRQLQYVAAKADWRLSVVPTQLNIDPIDGYPADNGVHPNGDGYRQIGATIYCWLQAKMADSIRANSASLIKPFWRGDVVEGESVLFVRDNESVEAEGSLLFPISDVLSVRSSSGEITYEAGKDYRFVPGTSQIVIPRGSRVVTKLPSQLRRPDNSQRHKLTHRDGNGEILFGGNLEYHQMQTSVTYKKADKTWPVAMPSFDPKALPVTIGKLRDHKDVSIVLLGDSISTGCNASSWGGGAPFQPAYQDLLVEALKEHYDANVQLANLSVGGMSTPWGLTMIDQAVAHQPDLVIIAFGMNDSASRSATEYGENTAAMIKATQATHPETEFILVASMLGNRDWLRLNHDAFPAYRNQLAALCKPGIALADMTSVWAEFLNRKQDSDLTGNGVNHPNDFGHRVYAQVMAALLIE